VIFALPEGSRHPTRVNRSGDASRDTACMGTMRLGGAGSPVEVNARMILTSSTYMPCDQDSGVSDAKAHVTRLGSACVGGSILHCVITLFQNISCGLPACRDGKLARASSREGKAACGGGCWQRPSPLLLHSRQQPASQGEKAAPRWSPPFLNLSSPTLPPSVDSHRTLVCPPAALAPEGVPPSRGPFPPSSPAPRDARRQRRTAFRPYQPA